MAVDLLTTNETYFFREPKHYDLLQQELALPTVRTAISVCGVQLSSFGDEAYSTAMLMADMQTRGQIGAGWSILATDISHRVLLAVPRKAIFPEDRLRAVSPERLRRYCLRGEGASQGQVMVQDKIRQKVQVRPAQSVQALSMAWGSFDVVFLRNVLIYFDPPTKSDVVDRVLADPEARRLVFSRALPKGAFPARHPISTSDSRGLSARHA